ncbi:MAG: undecaprenyl-diphosphate phosphatase [Gammaproteobacteria bacterium]|nr:undecaprenyl-diphosphate phosphatase [Gammaproteobacteria bacterium]
MEFWQAMWLALVQGLTEFLPISSAGHLVLAPRLLGWADQGLAFDVAVHLGSLVAVMLYFQRDLLELAMAPRQNARLLVAIFIGTLPAGIAGLLLRDYVEGQLRGPLVVASATVVFAVVLYLADRYRRRREARGVAEIRWGAAAFIGFSQALALVPGTSRSGITISAGLLLGLSREAAARFSFLLAVPIILAASAIKGLDLLTATVPPDWGLVASATAVAAVSAFACIHLFLRLIERIGMTPFVIYRLALGAVLFWMFL